MNQRYDLMPINVKARLDSDGYLHDSPIVARTGLLTYNLPNGKKQVELRLDEDVFHPDSLSAFAGKPITIGHKAMVNSSTFRKYAVGTAVGAGYRSDEGEVSGVRVPMVIQDKSAVDSAVSRKLTQLSVGYDVDFEQRPGWYNEKTKEVKFDDEGELPNALELGYTRFDGVQRNIRPNHIGMVKRGRAGIIAKLNLDGDEEYPNTDDENPNGGNMPKIRLDGIEYEASQEVINALEKEQSRADGLESTNKTISGENAILKTQVSEHEEKLKAARQDGFDEGQKAASELAEVIAVAKIAKVNTDGLDVISIKKAVIKAVTKQNFDEQTDEGYVNGAYNVAAAQASTIQNRRTVNTPEQRGDSDDLSPAEMSRKQMIDRTYGNVKKDGK